MRQLSKNPRQPDHELNPAMLLEQLLATRKGDEPWERTVVRLNRRDRFRKLLLSLVAVGALAVAGGRLSRRQSSQLWNGAVDWLLSEPGRRNRVRRALARYARERTIVFTEDAGVTIIQLSEDGQRLLQRASWKELTIKRPTRWDGRWRVVLFDIPEKQRPARDVLRAKLQALGFAYVQKSAWVHPYPCESIIAAYRELYEVGPYVTILVADSIDNEERLRRRFHLN